MNTPAEIENKLKEIKPFLKENFFVSRIGYFGSFANNTYKEASDIDVIVDFNGKVGWKFFDLKDYLETVLERRVDLVTSASLKKQWRQAILQQVRYI
ncbi:MAG: nucleotidyltransferase family protein [Bacteroidota bacterium]